MLGVTGQQVVNQALTILGLNEQGGTPNVSDSNDTLTELNVMWDAWSIDEGLIPAVVTQRFPWAAGVASQTIGLAQNGGPAGNIPLQSPSRVYRARVTVVTGGAITGSALAFGGLGYNVNDTGIVLGSQGNAATYTVNSVGGGGAVATYTISGPGTGNQIGQNVPTLAAGAQPGAGSGFTINITTVSAPTQLRVELDVVPAGRYYHHKDLSATAATPDEIYPDYNPDPNGLERLFMYPVPSSALTVELEVGLIFQLWTLTTTIFLTQGMLDDLQYALAFRCLPRFGAAVDQATRELVMALGEKAEARFRDNVAKMRGLTPDEVAPAGEQPSPAGGQ